MGEKNMVRFLSYPIKKRNPAYGKSFVKTDIICMQDVAKGASCTKFKVSIESHSGTHVDCPAHFFKKAKAPADYPAKDWLFKKPCAINLTGIRENELICPEHLRGMRRQADIVLIRTGFNALRGRGKYSCDNPGVSAETGIWLRKNYPSVRAIGFDFISLSPYRQREEGRKAHRAFLNPVLPGHPVLIIEDMDLSYDLSGLIRVWVVPLRVESFDSAPCTVLGVFKD